jgi:hypothetical protein
LHSARRAPVTVAISLALVMILCSSSLAVTSGQRKKGYYSVANVGSTALCVEATTNQVSGPAVEFGGNTRTYDLNQCSGAYQTMQAGHLATTVYGYAGGRFAGHSGWRTNSTATYRVGVYFNTNDPAGDLVYETQAFGQLWNGSAWVPASNTNSPIISRLTT